MEYQVRLDDKTREIIKSEVANELGVEAIVRLFGSRADDTQRGGDIDLLIEPNEPLAHRIQAECRLSARLHIKLKGRKVDVLIKEPFKPLLPIYEQALRNGIVL
jgi:predicted nucleotidyltransferase